MDSHHKYELLAPFIESAIKIVAELVGLPLKKEKVYKTNSKVSEGGMGVLIELEGDIKANVIYEFSRGISLKLATKMIKKNIPEIANNPQEFKALLEHAITELANQITGKAVTIAYQNGINIQPKPPQPFIGKGFTILPPGNNNYVIKLSTPIGYFYINISIPTS